MAKYQTTREMSYNDVTKTCQHTAKCETEITNQEIRCSQCGQKLVPKDSVFLNDLVTPNAKSIRSIDIFGMKNLTVQEFVNPHNFHFHSIQVIRN